jgi:hypothetical protein
MLATIRSRILEKILKIRIYKTIILLVVLCWCETWSLTLREEHRLRILKLVVRILLRVLGQVQGFRLTKHCFEYFIQ